MFESVHWACYIALKPKVQIRDLSRLCRAPNSTSVSVAWFDSSYLHVTLSYLGFLSASEVEKVGSLLESVEPKAPREIELTGELTIYKTVNTPRLVALVNPKPDLLGYQLMLAERLRRLSLDQDPVEFVPHVSLGLLPRSSAVRSKSGIIRSLKIEIEGCFLFESRERARRLR